MTRTTGDSGGAGVGEVSTGVGASGPPLGSYGAVEGLCGVRDGDSLSFTLRDHVHDVDVDCVLERGQEPLADAARGRRAIVEGWVARDALTGAPIRVERITAVVVLPDAPPGGYKLARGALPRRPGDPSPEERIRRARDAWGRGS